MQLVETHAHLYSEEFIEDLNAVMERATEAGVARIYMPNIDIESIDRMMEIEAKYPHTYATIGLHPCYVKKDFEKQLYVMEDWLNQRPFVAIGETGTDLYWDKSFFEQQKESLKIQIQWAKQWSIPIILHCRDSFEETIAIIEACQSESLSGVFHCFTGNVDDAKRVVDCGFKIGVGGVATFRNGGLDKVLPHIDTQHIVLETDSPYLAPVPHRGKRNEVSYIGLVAQRIADIKKMSVEDLAGETTKTANELFKSDQQIS